jgi:hypothetical protein
MDVDKNINEDDQSNYKSKRRVIKSKLKLTVSKVQVIESESEDEEN